MIERGGLAATQTSSAGRLLCDRCGRPGALPCAEGVLCANCHHGGRKRQRAPERIGSRREAAVLYGPHTEREGPPLEERRNDVGGTVRPRLAQDLTSDPTVGASEVRLPECSAADLLCRGGDSPGLEYLPLLGHEGFVVRGWSHILAAYPKTGKTEIVTDAVLAWVRKGMRVLYFTEESESIWRQRLSHRSSATGLDRLRLAFALEVGTSAVRRRIETGDEDVVVIDTIRSILGIVDESDNALVARELLPLVAACRHREITLILLHHENKVGGEHGRGISGAHAFLGMVDVGLELLRHNPKAPNRRLLKGQARVIVVPELVYEKADNGELRPLGAADELALEKVKGRALMTLGGEFRSTRDVRHALPEPRPSVDQLTKALTALAEEGRVERDPPLSAGSQPGSTYRWKRPNPTSDDPPLRSEVRCGPDEPQGLDEVELTGERL